ncbi:MAG: PP0621 family protein [Burkholderiaceae bacterium]
MVARLLLWIVLGIAAWWMLRPRRRVEPPSATTRDRAAPAAPPEAMVDCAACGLHFPASEAVRDGARVFCCTAHRDAGPRSVE